MKPSAPLETQGSVLKHRQFLPFFLTQFCGAFNDNLFKNALILFVTFAASEQMVLSTNIFINLAAGLFILPFFIFSASAGVLADHMDKSRLIQYTKAFEIVIMILGAVGFYTQSYFFLLFLLFLMGTQSAIFGPSKYAILPVHLKGKALISGNAWVELGTFLAILFGTLVAGVIVDSQDAQSLAAIGVCLMAVLGFMFSLFIPKAPASLSLKDFEFKPKAHTKQTLAICKQDKGLGYAILAISWFWLLGATYLTQIPNYTKIYLSESASSVSILLALFSFGIAIGSLTSGWLIRNHPKVSSLLLGVFGLSVAGFALHYFTPEAAQNNYGVVAFLLHLHFWPIFGCIFLLGVSGALFIVPLYIYLQKQAQDTVRAQVIAANNIFNSLFMVVSALLGIVTISLFSLQIEDLFLLLSSLNVCLLLALLIKPIPHLKAHLRS